jgi:hypothetical protein
MYFDDGDADLEIGLRWNRRPNDFNVSMRFEIVGSNVVADPGMSRSALTSRASAPER